MTGAHRQGADHDTIALSNPAIGNHAAEQRREVNETGVESENLRGERLRRERPDNRFQRGTESRKSADVLDMSRQQQLIYHVKDDQRRHSVIGKSLPSFGEGEVEKTFGVTQEVRFAGARQLSFACGQRIVLALHLRGSLTDEPALLLAKLRWESSRMLEMNRQ